MASLVVCGIIGGLLFIASCNWVSMTLIGAAKIHARNMMSRSGNRANHAYRRVGRVFEAHHAPQGGPRRLGPPYLTNPPITHECCSADEFADGKPNHCPIVCG